MRRTIILLTLAALAAVAFFACAESTDGAAVDGGGGGVSPTDAGNRVSDVVSPTATDARAMGSVVLNELSASEEWVEIVNGGATAVDIGGYKIADREKEGGAPKLSDAVSVPPNTMLAPNAYLIVQGGSAEAGPPPCPDGGQSFCLSAKWGVSNKAGETIFLFDATGTQVGAVEYPPSAVAKGESWGRIPNADPTGAFQKNVPTPGAANQAK